MNENGTIGALGLTQDTKHIPLWKESLAFYRRHSFSVIKALLPPSLIAYVFAFVIQQQIAAVKAHILSEAGGWMNLPPSMSKVERLVLPMQALALLKELFVWICYCFALVGICELVRRWESGDDGEDSIFVPVRENALQFLQAALLFFGMLLIAFFASISVSTGIQNLGHKAHLINLGFLQAVATTFVGIALVSAVIVRYVFVVPLMTFDRIGFRSALQISDRMTDHQSLALWGLILESEVMGYLSLVAPALVLSKLPGRETAIRDYAGIAAGLFLAAISQAPLMVAIALLFARQRGTTLVDVNSSALTA